MTKENHLDIYEDRSELHMGENVTIFLEDKQDTETTERYNKVFNALSDGYLDDVIKALPAELSKGGLDEPQQVMLKRLVDGLTSEVGRALVGLSCLQLTIKSIEPDQSIRLHKGSTAANRFSWKNGISMRSLDNTFNTPFLRQYGLLNMNKDGIMMTRSLAENYPYSWLYKAELRGPADEWLEIVEALEAGTLPPYPGLCYLISLLKNRSDEFADKVGALLEYVTGLKSITFERVKSFLINFFETTDYSARAFEVVIHAFMQAYSGMGILPIEDLVPLSQMRSANKKHENIGDIEIQMGDMIIESWDAKYGKSYLRDELDELNDKLKHHSAVEIAGFITNSNVDRRNDVIMRANEIALFNNCSIQLLTFEEWIEQKISVFPVEDLDELGSRWLIAVVESFGQKRKSIAPIDEPCDAWIDELQLLIKKI